MFCFNFANIEPNGSTFHLIVFTKINKKSFFIVYQSNNYRLVQNMFNLFKNIDKKGHQPQFGGLDILKYIGPGWLVTVGFIDPVINCFGW